MVYNQTNLFELDRYFKNIELTSPSNYYNKFIIVRLDGVKFRKVWKAVNEEERVLIQKALEYAATEVLKCMRDSFISYIQSDEISIVFSKERSKSFKLQKFISIISSRITLKFNKYLINEISDKQCFLYKIVSDGIYFDCRVLAVEYSDIHKYIVYRQLFCIINSYNKVLKANNRRHINPTYFHYEDMKLLNLYPLWDKCPSFEKYGVLILKEGKYFNTYNKIKFLGKSNLLEEFINNMNAVSR